MGAGTSSRNAVNETVKVMTQISNTATTDCVYTINQDQSLTVNASGGSTVSITDANFMEFANVDQKCVSTVATNSKVKSQIESQIKQIATSISQAFQLPSGGDSSSNLDNILENLKTAVANAYTGTCSQNFNQTETATFNASGGSTITVGVLNYNDTFQSVQDCIFQDDAVTQASNVVQNTISQKAKSEVESIFGPLLALLLIVILVVVVITLGGFKELTNPKFLIAISVIIAIYLVIAFTQKWWPFHPKGSS